jgi:hypothetical protein
MDVVMDAIIEKDRLLATQEGLMGFLLDEVVNPAGNIITIDLKIIMMHLHSE